MGKPPVVRIVLKSIWILIIAGLFAVVGPEPARTEPQLRPVTIQLKWFHQFQFAGFYQAQAQGYFRDAGLDVTLLEGRPDFDPVDAVIDRKAEFGVGCAELVLARANGMPVVAVAAIFQHSPFIVIAKTDVVSIHDLVGKRMMIEPHSAELFTYLWSEHVLPQSIVALPHTGNPLALEGSEVDALTAYVTDEPFLLNEAGVRYRVFDPKTSGVDFYGDTLFTRDDVVQHNPELVRKVRTAVIKGWSYALSHQSETIDLILDKYSKRKSRAALSFEAQVVQKLAVPEMVEIGYMNPGRWQFIADSFLKVGMTSNKVNVNGFLFDNHPPVDLLPFYLGLGGISLVAAIAALVATWMRRLNRKLNQEIAARTKLEEELRRQAGTDHLTGLHNRRSFWELAEHEMLKSRRFGTPLTVLMIDIDHFKSINDGFGHAIGDQVLCRVAQVCHKQLREVDVIGRIGGEEFAVLLPHTEMGEGLEVAERIRDAVAKSAMGDTAGSNLFVTCSIGVSSPPTERNVDEMLDQADTALYKAKKAGRNCVCSA